MVAIERGLPTNIDYERLVLGCCMLYPDLMQSARPVVDRDDFSLEINRRIWGVSCELYDSGKPVELATVGVVLREHRALFPGSGPLAYLASLTDGVPQLPSLDAYVQGVKDKALLRSLIATSQHTINRCLEGVESPQAILESLGQMAHGLIPAVKNGGLQSAGEVIDEIGLSTILRPRREQGLLFPWQWMNYRTGGMLPAELWILAGHTSTGKTSAMLQHAVSVARKGKGVAIFSLEVGKGSLIQKAIYQSARIDGEEAKRGHLSREDQDRVNRAADEIYGLPLYLDTQSTTTMAIHSAVRRLKQRNAVDHVIVDYLQLLGNTGKYDNRAQAVGANAWALKILATDFQVPVLLLSQFTRESNKPGKQREPDLTDLKESGDIENHANGVWFLHRTNNEDSNQMPMRFMLAKQRDGRRNVSQDFWFFPQYQRFEQVTEGDDE